MLYVALLAGGLFVLGFLCGGRAQAAEGGTAPAPRPASAAQSAAASAPTVPGTSSVRPDPADRAKESTKPLTEQAVPSVRETVDQVVRPVVDTVRTVTDTVTDGLSEGRLTVPPLQSLPILSELPILSDLPGLSDLPSLPELPGAPDDPSLPGIPTAPTLPGDVALPVPPGQASPAPAADAPARRHPEQATAHDDAEPAAGRRAPAAAPRTYGPRPVAADLTLTTGAARGTVGSGPRAGHAPPEQAPAGDPDGMAGNRSALGDGASRHFDGQAVTSNHRAPLRLAPGATARGDAPATRDRHRDIPVFPG